MYTAARKFPAEGKEKTPKVLSTVKENVRHRKKSAGHKELNLGLLLIPSHRDDVRSRAIHYTMSEYRKRIARRRELLGRRYSPHFVMDQAKSNFRVNNVFPGHTLRKPQLGIPRGGAHPWNNIWAANGLHGSDGNLGSTSQTGNP
ncbi:hypothetical protein B0H11DRAFT_2195740 [Mycena galericulata]|nr:hypothetical protein B0H11DRAFT_2195740 [Mycena galericulata]